MAVRYFIGDLVVDSGTGRVTCGEQILDVTGLTYDLLVVLAETAPDIVSHDQLAEQVWGGRPVTPETIAQRARMLDEALADDANKPSYIEFVRDQGYRLIVPVEIMSARPGSRASSRRLHFAALFVIGLMILGYVVSSLLERQ